MQKQETFQVIESLVLENSFGVIKEQKSVTLKVTVGVKPDGPPPVYLSPHTHCVPNGWFEVSDVETGGDEWYAEGGLWFEGLKLVDYDGVFSLPSFVINKLTEWGYDASYAE